MDGWGEKMLATVSTVAEIVASGLSLERDAFTCRMQLGPHLLAPTGAPSLESFLLLAQGKTGRPCSCEGSFHQQD